MAPTFRVCLGAEPYRQRGYYCRIRARVHGDLHHGGRNRGSDEFREVKLAAPVCCGGKRREFRVSPNIETEVVQKMQEG